MNTLHLYNGLAQKQNHASYMTVIDAYKESMYCSILKHIAISHIMEQKQIYQILRSNHYVLATGNGTFGGLFTCSRCEHISKMAYGWWNDKYSAIQLSIVELNREFNCGYLSERAKNWLNSKRIVYEIWWNCKQNTVDLTDL